MVKKGDYRYKIDEGNVTLIQEIEDDYRRRQGNIVLKLCKAIDAEYYERSKKQKYKTNSRWLKKRLGISNRKVRSLFKKFFLSFGRDSHLLERDFSNRLQEIEEEIKREQQKKEKEGNRKD